MVEWIDVYAKYLDDGDEQENRKFKAFLVWIKMADFHVLFEERLTLSYKFMLTITMNFYKYFLEFDPEITVRIKTMLQDVY